MRKVFSSAVALSVALVTSLPAQQADSVPRSAQAAEMQVAQAAPPTGGAPAPRSGRSVRSRAAAANTSTPQPATPAPKKRGLMGVFGGRQRATPVPAPAPEREPVAATPAPATPKSRVKRRQKATDSKPETKAPSTPAAEPKSEEPAPEGTKPPATPAPAEPTSDVPPTASTTEPEATPAPATGKRGKAAKTVKATPEEAPKLTPEQVALQKAQASGDAEAIEKAKYDEAKARALQDERVKELKQKADEATTEEEGRRALRAYNKALFQKMRSLEGSISGRVDEMESAVLKRLEPAGQ